MSTSEIEEASFIGSLQRADEYLGRLEQLPSTSVFANAVESDLWKTVTAKSEPPDEVPYTELPERARSLIGTYETEDGPVEPWWLQEFTWTASFGGKEVELRGDGLEKFSEKFDRDRTVVQRPELERKRFGDTLLDTLEAFGDIRDRLEDRIDPAPDATYPDLPESLFSVEEGLVETTDGLEDWIDEFISLTPGIGPEATALYLAHTGTSRVSAESVLDDELFNAVDRVIDFKYDTYEPPMVKSFDTVLGLSTVFDRVIPVDDSYEPFSGLQYQLYRGFLETFDPEDEFTVELLDTATTRVPSKLDPGEEGLFTRVACGTPLIHYADDRPKLMSVRMYSPKTSGSSGYSDGPYEELAIMFEAEGWFGNA